MLLSLSVMFNSAFSLQVESCYANITCGRERTLPLTQSSGFLTRVFYVAYFAYFVDEVHALHSLSQVHMKLLVQDKHVTCVSPLCATLIAQIHCVQGSCQHLYVLCVFFYANPSDSFNVPWKGG